MQNKKGLSDVVTTVMIIALSLVAITVVWVVVSSLINENTDTISSQGDCLQTNLEIVSVSSTGSAVTVVVKRTSGDSAIAGVKINAYNAAGLSVSANATGAMSVGDQKSTTLTIASATKVAATPYFIIDNKQVVCSNVVEKDI
jgi:hypothetical protein